MHVGKHIIAVTHQWVLIGGGGKGILEGKSWVNQLNIYEMNEIMIV